MPAATLCRTCVPVYERYSTCTRACASTDCFPVRAANRELYRGNENSTVRWAVPTPQMYSVGGLTCIYETRARARARAPPFLRARALHTRARVHRKRHTHIRAARAYKPWRRLVACRSTCHSPPHPPRLSPPLLTLFIHQLYPKPLSVASFAEQSNHPRPTTCT